MRRFFETIVPITHLNGKLAPAAEICHPLPDSSSSLVSFLYGYRKKGNPRSRFALRTKARNLAVKPYTAGETAAKSTFTAAVAAVIANRSNWHNAVPDFQQQSKYVTLYNFILAETIKNGGVFPNKWL